MMQCLRFGLAVAGTAIALQASASTTITFESLAVGTTLSSQFAGVIFSANPFTGSGGPTGDWATNTNMTIVSSTGADVGGLGGPALVSGNILRSFGGWLGENGDPSFRVNFASAIDSFSADFAGVANPGDVRLFAYNGSTLLGVVAGSTIGQFSLGFAAQMITSIVVTPGSFDDWIGVDNITYNVAAAVPEPETYALMALGLAAIALARRRAKRG